MVMLLLHCWATGYRGAVPTCLAGCGEESTDTMAHYMEGQFFCDAVARAA